MTTGPFPIPDHSGKTRLFRLTLLVVGLALPLITAARPQTLFAAPGSGRPVARYELSLATTSGSQVFQVPDDCDRIEELYRVGGATRDRIIDRRLWMKAAGDCHYFALLHGNDSQHLTDHLAGYDFDALSLDDLPEGILCGGPPIGWCVLSQTPTSNIQPLFPEPKGGQGHEERLPCRLVSGQLRAEVWQTSAGLLCVPNQRASVRLVGLNAADINGDGIRDRILRLILISPDLGRRTVRLPLTRLAPEAPLSVPGREPVKPD